MTHSKSEGSDCGDDEDEGEEENKVAMSPPTGEADNCPDEDNEALPPPSTVPMDSASSTNA